MLATWDDNLMTNCLYDRSTATMSLAGCFDLANGSDRRRWRDRCSFADDPSPTRALQWLRYCYCVRAPSPAVLARFLFRENFDRQIVFGMAATVAGAAFLAGPLAGACAFDNNST